MRNRNAAGRLEHLNTRAERAILRGNAGKGLRLAAKAGRAQEDLERATGRAWERWGRPCRD